MICITSTHKWALFWFTIRYELREEKERKITRQDLVFLVQSLSRYLAKYNVSGSNGDTGIVMRYNRRWCCPDIWLISWQCQTCWPRGESGDQNGADQSVRPVGKVWSCCVLCYTLLSCVTLCSNCQAELLINCFSLRHIKIHNADTKNYFILINHWKIIFHSMEIKFIWKFWK